MPLEARHPVSIVGEHEPLRVLARGTLVDLGPAIVKVRLDEGEEAPTSRQTVVVVVHRTKPDLVLGTVSDLDGDPRVVFVARVARPE